MRTKLDARRTHMKGGDGRGGGGGERSGANKSAQELTQRDTEKNTAPHPALPGDRTHGFRI